METQKKQQLFFDKEYTNITVLQKHAFLFLTAING